MTTSKLYKSTLERIGPPWLQRLVGKRLLGSIGEVLDEQVDRLADGVKLRFPGLGDESALPYIGRDRLLRRGVVETAATYALRLRAWWDAHRLRGGPYALLEQLHAFWLGELDVRKDVVYYSGTRRSIDPGGTITADAISWSADGSGKWARVWVFFHLWSSLVTDSGALFTTDTGETIVVDFATMTAWLHPLVTGAGDTLITDTGDTLIADPVPSGSLPDADAEMLKLIPREWTAAHIDKTTVVLLFGTAELWDYPAPVGIWDDGGVWQTNDPIQLVV